MKNIESLRALLSSPKKITIVTHPRPDGDAMGSSLGLYNFLEIRGHQVSVILPTEYPDYFKWMKGNNQAFVYTHQMDKANEAIRSSELVFCLDFNNLNRIEPLDKVFKELEVPFVLIDHHLQPDTFDYMLHSTGASSSCELVYDLFELLEGEEVKITKDIANCLYTGIVTDTGNFQNSATSVRSFQLAAKFMSEGVKLEFIREKVFNNFREKRLRFLGNALSNRMVVLHPLKAAYITVTKEDVRRYDLDAGDTEGLVNYPLTIKGIKVAVLMKEHGNIVKLSFRSKGDLSVNEFARKHFEGGGHRNAAGGRSKKSLQQTIVELVNLWKKELG